MIPNPHNRDPHVQVIVSLGRADFGRCPIGSKRPAALWPVAGMTALEHLLAGLSRHGVDHVVICASREYAETLHTMHLDARLGVDYVFEELPLGTAGCLREVSESCHSDVFVIMSANTLFPPSIEELLDLHAARPADLTVFYNPPVPQSPKPSDCSDIFVCERRAIDCIPDAGFCDIKEGLVPQLLREGLRVRKVGLKRDVGHFRDRVSYLQGIETYLESLKADDLDGYTWLDRAGSDQARVLVANSAEIHQEANLRGPVMVMEGAHIGRESTILGPATVEPNVRINEGCILSNSAIWQGASLARGCEVQRSVIEDCSQVDAFARVADTCISMTPTPSQARRLLTGLEIGIGTRLKQMPTMTGVRLWGIGLAFAAFIWCYWTTLSNLWGIWSGSDEYSCGLLVPVLVLYVLYTRRVELHLCPVRPCLGWGMVTFVCAQGIRFLGLFFMYGSLERLSLVLSLYGLAIMLFGLQFFRKTLGVHVFLLFMLPWPSSVQSRITLPLQEWATASAVSCLDMLWPSVIREGNIIVMGDTHVAVAEACNGLRMITAFLVITYLFVLLVNRSRLQKGIILVSSLPIALLCNTIRLTATSLIFTQVKGEHWEQVFHDFGGYAMMPLALGMIMLELWLMTKLTTPPLPTDVVTAGGRPIEPKLPGKGRPNE